MRRLSLLVFSIFVGLAADAFAQTTFSPTDGMTPVGLEAGSPAGSYALGGLDTVNLYNGSANLAIPLLKIGGRGDAGYMMVARYDPHWDGNGFMSTSASDGCSEAAPCPMWAFAPGTVPSSPYSSRPAGITIRPLGQHVQPIYIGGSSTPSCYANGTTLTRISVSFADGTEMTLVDTVTGGTPVSPPLNSSSCAAQGLDRGTRFVATDGSAAIFLAENHIYDVNTPGATALPGETAAGTLYLRDGRQFHFGDYHIVPGFPSLTVTAVDRLRDRNGNQTTFNYSVTIPSGFQSAFAVIDPLGRVINVAEGQGFSFLDPGCTASCVGVYDQITYGPTGQQKTITVYRRDYWYDRISSLQTSTRPTYQSLFGGYASPSAAVFNWAIWKIVLPDNHAYQFHYTQYGEAARLDLPTGGHYEFDWVNGPFTDAFDLCLGNPLESNKCPVIRAPSGVQASFGNTSGYDLLLAVYRRVRERREYVDAGSSWTRRTYYMVEEIPPPQSLEDPLGQCGYTSNINFVSGYCSRITTAEYDAALGLLSSESHHFYGAVSRYQSLFPQVGWYSWWLEGKEFRTDVIRPGDGVILRKQLQTWQPRAIPGWWQSNPSLGPQPAQDPRVGGSDLIIDGGKMARKILGYATDDTNNIVDVSEYDYGNTSGSQGPLLRRAHTDLVTNYNNPSAGVYLRDLTLAEMVYDGSNNVVAQTQYGYDENIPLPEPGIVQNVSVPAQRGNVTHMSRWRNTDGVWLTTAKTYDVAGNVMNITNPGGGSTSYTYTDCMGMYAYVTVVTNAASHATTFGHSNCTLGHITSITDANGLVTTAQYNDVLERLTNVVHPNGQRILYSYSVDLTTVTTKSDQYVDQQIISFIVSDGLGRTIETRLGNVSTKRDLDALGRVKKQYNPGSTTDATAYTYDALGRVASITHADGSRETFVWTGDSVIHTDPASKQLKQRVDALGRIVEVTEDPASLNPLLTSYAYNTLDDLTTVVQGAQTRSFVYDSLKQLRAVTNPEVGAVVTNCLGQTVSECYSYDVNGMRACKPPSNMIR
ncbi:MAG: hypothetical protein DMG14_22890 [Acidobacteria bacterium]|nr:MAG: hypothetical protein DMG14_22890 [Acidobacteriota bacterium]